MIDTHTHLYLPEFNPGGQACAVQRALDAGVERLIFPNVDLSTIAPMKALAAEFPELTAMAMGLHPTEIKEDWKDVLAQIMEELNSPTSYIAVGEIGIDLYWDNTFRNEQMLALEQQLAEARKNSLPVIIHCREGLAETLEVMDGFRDVKAVFHSFGGSADDVSLIRRRLDSDLIYFGINGIVTFKNSGLKKTLPEITSDRIVLETDSPYLAPVPHRGKRNESAYIPFICRTVADAVEMSAEEISRRTDANAKTLFHGL